jgi:UDP-GlcNAc:undecaprenyl-phosphate GlcNAc-1-phosphate transferase
VREYVLTGVLVAAVTYLLTPYARKLAIRTRAFAEPRDRDVHTIPTPYFGGIAMYVGLCAGLLVASRLQTLHQVFRFSDVKGVLYAGGVLVLLGVADDRWELDALTKLAGQILAAAIMVREGLQLIYNPIPDKTFGALSLGQGLGVPLTIIFVVLTINAVNFVDGLDGLAAGVVAIAALSFFAYSYELSVVHHLERASPPTLLTAVLAGACIGFLPHNFNPARIFMGDSGSMLLGLVLAAATISLTGTLDPNAIPSYDFAPGLLPLVLPVAVLAIPLIDLLLAVLRRGRRGLAPWAPDKQHLHHRLMMIGHSHARAVLIMYMWSALIAGGTVSVALAHGRPLLVLSVILAGAAVLLVATNIPRLRHTTRPT